MVAQQECAVLLLTTVPDLNVWSAAEDLALKELIRLSAELP